MNMRRLRLNFLGVLVAGAVGGIAAMLVLLGNDDIIWLKTFLRELGKGV